MKRYTDYIISLLKSAILDTTPAVPPEGVDIDTLFNIAHAHQVANILYLQLRKCDSVDKEKLSLFKTSYMKALYLDLKQQYYLNLIIDAFEKNQIRHMMMKGSVIKALYPSSDLRRSGDLDIYVFDEDTSKAKEIMEQLGFETIQHDDVYAHDEYVIDGVIKVELHRKLISNKCPWDKECQKIVERIILQEPYQYRYVMTDDDYYLHMIGHMAKHMKYSGIGFKMFLDVWIYYKHYETCMDMERLNQHLTECGLYDFNTHVLKLCHYWFCDQTADALTLEMADYVSSSGNFGTYQQLLSGEMAQNAMKTKNRTIGKTVYYIKTLFMPFSHMKLRYPILQKIPLLLPLCWMYRAYDALVLRKERGKQVAERYNNADIAYGEEILLFKKKIGL